jgi:hypothetical protein
MAKTTNNHPLGKKINRVIYLLEALLALELNRTNLDRNKIRDRLGIEKVRVNKILDGIERNNLGNLDGARPKGRQKKSKIRGKK